MDFFDGLGKKVNEAYQATADKTGKIAKETMLRLKMGDIKVEIDDIYQEIGKNIYENHVREDKQNIDEIINDLCTKIDVLSDEIKSIEKQCMDLKNKKQCPKCFIELDKNEKYCHECGEKQPESVTFEL